MRPVEISHPGRENAEKTPPLVQKWNKFAWSMQKLALLANYINLVKKNPQESTLGNDFMYHLLIKILVGVIPIHQNQCLWNDGLDNIITAISHLIFTSFGRASVQWVNMSQGQILDGQ